MSYALFRPLLFALEAERAHSLTLAALGSLHRLGLSRLAAAKPLHCPRRVMGLDFANPVGLAAGLDKNGDHIDALATLGFGFLEIGTVTPRPQPGNPRPRLYRLPRAQALINRMGFNNAGVEHVVARVAQMRYRGVLGINIGKNFDTPLDRAVDDYLIGLRAVYRSASYVTVNISSPNTASLRDLQKPGELAPLLEALKLEQGKLADEHGRYVPLAVKLAPDLDRDAIAAIAAVLVLHRIDGAIATNTTLARETVRDEPHANQGGGLSGAPLKAKARDVVGELVRAVDGALPVIGVGGVMAAKDAVALMDAGADLVQLYTGLVYRGPALVGEVARALCNRVDQRVAAPLPDEERYADGHA